MLVLVVADAQSARQKHIDTLLAPLGESEVLIYDDTYGSLSDLEQYLYPSLFSIAPPVVHVKFLLTDAPDAAFLKKLLASPTVFVFEEIMLPSPVLTAFKKAGAVVHDAPKAKAAPKGNDIFAATLALTASDKKSRWLAYRDALELHPIEAIMGILYWKVRDLMMKKDKAHYQALYRELLAAHARAWETGAPLELMIEKVILTH